MLAKNRLICHLGASELASFLADTIAVQKLTLQGGYSKKDVAVIHGSLRGHFLTKLTNAIQGYQL